MSVPNSVFADPVTTLMVCILIDGKEILPDVLQNEDIAKGVLIGGTDVESKSVHALNEITFLVTYSSGILAEEIGSAIEKIDKRLGKPVVIIYDWGYYYSTTSSYRMCASYHRSEISSI